MKMRSLAWLSMVIALVFSGCSASHDPGQADPVSPEKRTVVVAGPEYQANPVVSPDGLWVYFEADADGDMDIYRVPVAGGAIQKLTDNTVFDSAPSVAPDGSRLVFESDLTGTRHIYLLDLAQPQAGPTALTAGAFDDASPAWSPAGDLVVFESNRDKAVGLDLYTVDPATLATLRLTTTADGIYCRTADWAPDGSALVYESNAGGWSALYTVPATGGKGQQITPDAGYEGHPAWSPAGDVIAFESTRDGASQIYLTPVGGGPWTQLTVLGGHWPQWSPDGATIVYGVFDGADANVMTMPVP